MGWIHSGTPNSPGRLSGETWLGHGPGTCQALVATGLVPRALPLAMRRPTQSETWRTMAGDCEGCAVRTRTDGTSCRGSRMRSCDTAERAKNGMSSEHAETGVLTASGRMQRPRDGRAGEQLRANGTAAGCQLETVLPQTADGAADIVRLSSRSVAVQRQGPAGRPLECQCRRGHMRASSVCVGGTGHGAQASWQRSHGGKNT